MVAPVVVSFVHYGTAGVGSSSDFDCDYDFAAGVVEVHPLVE